MLKAIRFCFPFVAALLILCAGLLLAEPAGAGALLVTTLDDESNTDGDCSLREAVEAANTNAAVDACGSGDVLTDTITFDLPGTITLTKQLSVTAGGPLLIDGTDAITLSGAGTVSVFNVNSGAELALQNLTLTNGYADYGGGIYNNGTLNIADSTVSDNTAFYGGGIFNKGTLTIADSTLSGNYASWGGGGVYNIGTLTIANSTLSDNSSSNGGGIYNDYGMLTIATSTLSGNSSFYDGGGIANWGMLTITDSTLSGNSADDDGGGIYSYVGTLIITNSMLTGNSAEIRGGGIYNLDTLTILDSTLSDNSADLGGGIRNSGSLTITNSTLSGNISPGGLGGGLHNSGSSTITNSTLSGNFAQEEGGGIYNSGTLTIANSVVANSPYGYDCWTDSPITDGGHNLSSDSSCGFDTANGSLPDTDPLLGPLQDNGGPTWTHALLEGSPAIDAGDDAWCPPNDQRGVTRPLDGDQDGLAVCDIGSYEYSVPFYFTYLPMALKE